MIRRKNSKLMALIVATTILTTQVQIPVRVTAEVIQNLQDKEYYRNNFADESNKPGEVNGAIKIEDVSIENEMMKFDTKFDGTWDWDSNKHEFNFFTDSEENIPAGSLIDFDIIVPTDKAAFTGEIKFKGALKDGQWNWKDGSDGGFTSDKFEDLGNGFSKVTATATVSSDLNGLKAVVVQIIGGGTDYNGAMYLDNVKVHTKAGEDEVVPEVQPLKWSFNDAEKGTNGWEFGGTWAHQGNPEVSYDSTIGGGSLKLSLDFSKDTEVSWSEVKLQNNFDKISNINGYNLLTYDFIYDPSSMTMGAFKTKLYSNGAIDTYEDIKLVEVEDVEGGLKKAKVKVKFPSVNKDIDSLTLAVIGVNTNYKGDIYIDNIELSQEKAENIYVDITEEIKPQTEVDVNSLTLPKEPLTLVDEKATDETSSLYGYLMGLGETDKVIFGHQNDTHHKGGKYDIPGDNSGIKSDTLDITGSIAGMVGMDTLSFTGDELDGGVDAAAKVAIQAAKEGGVITLSAHMPNFEIVKDKGLDTQGNYDYSGYTPGVTKGNIVQRIMPDGDLNEVFLGYLDLIADYGLQLQESGVPVLFRPFHENNGSWFWWGKAFCDEQTYKNLFAYTVEYLRDVKGVHNFLYVYSPGGPFEDEADYLSRYPGDDFVDVLAFDMYHDNPTADDNWMEVLGETVELVQGLADKKGKLSALSEVGMRVVDSIGDGSYYEGIAQKGNVRKDWYNEVLDVVSNSSMPYFMTWANFDDKANFFMPYRMTETTGHEMINEFIDFYNDERSVFAKETGDFLSLNIDVNEEAHKYGYIVNPASGSRILDETTIKAVVKNIQGKVNFAIKDSSDNIIITLDAVEKDGLYVADITKEVLEKIGEVIGKIELRVDEEVLSTNSYFFNISEQEKTGNIVDDFENYLGESALLLNEWATNVGPGCSLTPKLTTESGNFNGGKYGLEFNYKISNAKTSEGWAGMTTAKDVDWSEYDALQLWIKPDGYGQKLVIQITSNGEDFEVFLPELAATTEPQLLTLKFKDFIGKNKGEFDPANITSIGIWCNTIVPQGHSGEWTVDSKMYFDDIKAVNTTAVVEKSISLDKTKIDLKVGNDTVIKATVLPENEEVIWSSSDEKIATVDENGKVIAVGKGNAKIIATIKDTDIFTTCDVNVTEKESIPVEPENPGDTSGSEKPVTPSEGEKPKEPGKGELPQTGGVNSVGVISLGGIITLVGAFIVKKKEEKL